MSIRNSKKFHITLLRHGQSTGNAGGYHQGQAEFPLTSKGKKQAEALSEYWHTRGTAFDQIISSPQSRARQTAEIIAHKMGNQVTFDSLWMERDNGIYSGLSHKEAQQKYPYPAFVPLYEPVGKTGESQWDLFLRAGHAIQRVLKEPCGDFLIVSHGGLLNMAMKAILGISPEANFQGPRFQFDNTAFASLVYDPDLHTWDILGVNARPHWVQE